MKTRPTHKRCSRCKESKSLCLANWRHRGEEGRRHEWRPECKACLRAAIPKKPRPERVNRPGDNTNRIVLCVGCGNLPHRVMGYECYKCGLKAGPDQPIELVTHRYWRYAM